MLTHRRQHNPKCADWRSCDVLASQQTLDSLLPAAARKRPLCALVTEENSQSTRYNKAYCAIKQLSKIIIGVWGLKIAIWSEVISDAIKCKLQIAMFVLIINIS